jgi:2-methylcitrate dehydratase PrpD
MNDQALTRALSEFAVGEVSLDGASWRHAADLFGNALAVGAAAVHEPQVERLESVARRLGGESPEAALWGREGRLQAEWGAFLNAYATHLHDYDDAHPAAMMEVGPVVVPVAVATAELRGAPAGSAIEAAYVGAEVAVRVALGLGPQHAERGWHVSGSAGVLGAAATAARLLGLSADLAEQSLGYGATQVAGISAQDGTDARALHPAKAAFNGIESARLVAAGLDGPRRILEGRRGLFALTTDGPRPELVLQGLGREWRALECHPKRYACSVLAQPAMEAALALRERVPLDNIAVVEIAVPPRTLASLDTLAPSPPCRRSSALPTR